MRQELEHPAAREPQAAVPVFLHADIALVADVAQARVAVARHDLRRLVRREIVDDHELEVRERLREHRFDRLADVRRAAIGRNTDRDDGRGAQGLSAGAPNPFVAFTTYCGFAVMWR